eukprot:jgi/Hompol1/11/HPOL_002424-RA
MERASARNSECPAATRLDVLAKALVLFDILKKTTTNIDATERLLMSDSVLKSIRLCLADGTKEIRIGGYRLLRMLVNPLSVAKLLSFNMDLFIIRTLIRDPRYDSEREQAMRFIRGCLDQPDGAAHIPMSIARILVAVAEQLDDRFRSACLETVCELGTD